MPHSAGSGWQRRQPRLPRMLPTQRPTTCAHPSPPANNRANAGNSPLDACGIATLPVSACTTGRALGGLTRALLPAKPARGGIPGVSTRFSPAMAVSTRCATPGGGSYPGALALGRYARLRDPGSLGPYLAPFTAPSFTAITTTMPGATRRCALPPASARLYAACVRVGLYAVRAGQNIEHL